MRMRVFGTIPKELYEWMREQIEAGRYHNQSHVIEIALKTLKEMQKK